MTKATPKPTDIKPPFTLETALAKVQAAENAWNSRDPNALHWPIPKIPNGETFGIYQRTRRNQRIFDAKMAKRT